MDGSAEDTARAVRLTLGRLRRRLREHYDRAELTASQLGVLTRLDREGPATVSDLAAAEGVRPQSMAMAVGAVIERGLVRRDPDPDDGRRQVASLTPAGQEFVTSSRAAGQGWLAGVLGERLTAEERMHVLEAMALLEKVVA
ncbi:MarR family transcriptional regulator [Actinomycetospora corticicola]|uniref:DNA-binding MarR family transcriptional regulator n=1 Tax=Actinomycetospora corticicola TaxID=663602 RepID=A0A7Y9DRT3_9PSEU|nr:MarR family transcriptional regulator [Actinomycetospora corticicola]NYD34366.1 DNA-binding MarR family transcriptional regulator [Actinomycetospora corticicola]